jgi:hypothetical protein
VAQLWVVRQQDAHESLYKNEDGGVYLVIMKKLIPYIISYLLVATGTFFYPRIYMHFASYPPTVAPHNSVAVILNPGISQDELATKLKQVGLSEFDPYKDKASPLPSRPSPVYSLVHHYVFDAVMLSAFAGLVILFRRIFPNHDLAA